MASNTGKEEVSGGEKAEPQICNIFISYQWKSQPKVKRLYSELVSYDFLSVFMDIFNIKAGNNLYASLATNIQQADVVLACVSRDYVKSKNCEREIIYADAFNKSIMPLYIEKIPIQELGSIGFILKEFFLKSIYLLLRNESIFESLRGSDELNDIIDGIASIITAKKLNVELPLKRGIERVIEEPSFDQAIMRFRNDSPLDEVFTNSTNSSSKEKPEERSRISTAEKKKDIPGSSIKQPEKPAKISLPKKESQDAKPKKINYFQVHPVIKELKCLTIPKVLLEPLGDRFEFVQAEVFRGGEIYYKPVGWIRYGLKISQLYPQMSKWLSKDGNPEEWSVVYHGFRHNPILMGVYKKLFDHLTNQFKPNFKLSGNMSYVSDLDVNKNSDGFNNSCGMGIFCSSRPDVAEKATAQFVLNGIKYKMLLQCRVHPKKIRIPQKNADLRIVNSMDFLRPYGILIKEI